MTPPPAKPLTITPTPVVPPAPPRPVAPPPKAAAPEPVATVTPPPVLFPLPAPSAFPATTPAPASGLFSGKVGSMLEQEKVRRLVESLADDAAVKAATLELVKKGPASLPVLLEALEWPNGVHRRRAFEVLKFLAKDAGPLEFDPDGPPDVRLRQVAQLRRRLEPRR